MTMTSIAMDSAATPASSSATSADAQAEMVFYSLAIVALAETLAFQTWGPVVLTLTALCLVPLMFVFFVAISWPGPLRRSKH